MQSRYFYFIFSVLIFGGVFFSGVPQKAYAAVAYDAVSESHTGTTGSTNQAAFSWTHTPVGTPRGVLVFVFTKANADYISSVTYGGATMTRVSGGQAIDSAGEPCRTDTFFLGSGVPTGAQTVTVNRTNNATVMYATAVTVTAANDTSPVGFVLLQENGTLAVQPVDDGSPGSNSVRFAGIFSGLASVPPAGSGSTVLVGIDFGANVVQVVRETTAGQGARNVGFSSATSDDRAAVHLAIRELPTIAQSAYRFFDNANSTDVGAALALQDTAATLGASGATFRLRTLLHIGANSLVASGKDFKLQFAQRSGTCDTGFSGETYTDVTPSSVIAYNNNSTPADGANLTANINDPIHAADTVINQSYEEANTFTNAVGAISAGQDGKWDFSLIDNAAPAGTTYCFRVRTASDANLDTYSVIPEITTASASAQSLMFSISDNTIGFGTLSSGAARYATGDTNGAASDSADAHTFSVSTNAASGYVVTINGTTLKHTANPSFTILPIGASAVASSPGSEQFGMRIVVNSGTGSTVAPYNTTNWAFDTATFPDIVASGAGNGVTTVFGARYIGNIAASTEAGSYSATLTYTATASF